MDLVIISTLCIGGIGLASGVALALADKYLSIPEDPRVAEIAALLPGVNCGGCGYAGCLDYARAIAQQGAAVTLCAPGGPECVSAIAACLGIEAAATARQVAIVRCCGDNTEALRRAHYNGIVDCAAAQATAGGDKACAYGCLGYGSCARVCPVQAVAVEQGLARIIKSACIACGRCISVCPRALIRLVPASATLHVLCHSRDKGPAVKKVCGTGCIGCRLCVKAAGDAMVMEGFLAAVNYDRPPANDQVVEVCPTRCLRKDSAPSSCPAGCEAAPPPQPPTSTS